MASDYDSIAPLYTQCGISLVVVDYRGYGASGGEPTSSTLLSDAREIVDQVPTVLAAHDVHPSKLLVMGRSIGSAPAIEAALHASQRVSGLILDSAFADTFALISRLGGPDLSARHDEQRGFGNLAKIARINKRVLVIHGEADWIIPVDEGGLLYARCGAADKQLLTIPNAGHNNLLAVDLGSYLGAVCNFVFR